MEELMNMTAWAARLLRSSVEEITKAMSELGRIINTAREFE